MNLILDILIEIISKKRISQINHILHDHPDTLRKEKVKINKIKIYKTKCRGRDSHKQLIDKTSSYQKTKIYIEKYIYK